MRVPYVANSSLGDTKRTCWSPLGKMGRLILQDLVIWLSGIWKHTLLHLLRLVVTSFFKVPFFHCCSTVCVAMVIFDSQPVVAISGLPELKDDTTCLLAENEWFHAENHIHEMTSYASQMVIEQQYHVLDLFGASQRIAQTWIDHGYRGVSFDINLSALHDICSKTGFKVLLSYAMQFLWCSWRWRVIPKCHSSIPEFLLDSRAQAQTTQNVGKQPGHCWCLVWRIRP